MFKMNSAFKTSWVDLSEFSLFQWVVSDIQLLPHDFIWLFVCWVSCSLSVCYLIYTRLQIFTLPPCRSPLYDNLHRYSRLELKVFLCVSSRSLWPETCRSSGPSLWRCFNVSSRPLDRGDEITAFGSSLSSNDVAFLDRRQRLPALMTWPHNNNCDFYPLWLWIESHPAHISRPSSRQELSQEN